MQDIVQRDGLGLFTTSEIIADRTKVSHQSVLKLVDGYRADIEEFGKVGFEIRAGYNNSQVRIAQLNEQQSTLLLSYMRNNDVVRKFKKDLVKGFYEMAQHIKELEQEPKTQVALSDDEIMHRALTISAGRLKALEAKVEEIAPKAEAYDTFIGADGTYSVGNVAKMLGMSQNKLFTELRNHGVLIGKGHMRNTPYQQYMHHFTVKAYTYTRSDGNEGTSYTTRVQPSGVDFIRKKLKLEEEAA